MAYVIPFRGFRFDTAKVGDISRVVTPPYDRIYEKEQSACYERSPYNIVRIVKGRPQPSDNGENVYSRASDHLESWIEQGVLVRDETPSLYAYHQTYSFGDERLTRKGVTVLGRLDPEKVHAHERTLKGPKEDRLRLMRACEANFGHIFMLYTDPERSADAALERAVARRPPTVQARDDDGNDHRVWQVTDSEVIDVVQAALAGKDLYIADGHHRYETAVNYMRECTERGWRPAAPESFDVRMMTLFNLDEPGMSIRPIHRLVHGLPDFEAGRFFARAEEAFEVVRHRSFEEMAAATREGIGQHRFGCAAGGTFASLSLRDEALMDRLLSEDWSRDYRRLDVSVLHAAILEELLGIDANALEEQRNLTYTVNAARGARQVATGEEQLLFLLNPTSADEVRRVADHGEKMPQKSTDFYPKLLTGLVLTRMEVDKG